LKVITVKVVANVGVELRQIICLNTAPTIPTTHERRQNLTLTTRPQQRDEVSPPSCHRWSNKRRERGPGPTSWPMETGRS
jgi:hypothetical protein